MMYVFLIIAGIILQIVGADILVKQGICFAKTTKNSMFNTAILLGISGAAGWNIVNAILCGEQHQTQNVMTTSVMGSLFMILLRNDGEDENSAWNDGERIFLFDHCCNCCLIFECGLFVSWKTCCTGGKQG